MFQNYPSKYNISMQIARTDIISGSQLSSFAAMITSLYDRQVEKLARLLFFAIQILKEFVYLLDWRRLCGLFWKNFGSNSKLCATL